MSIGTRKKILDFKKMLNNDIESEYSFVEMNNKSHPKGKKRDQQEKNRGNSINELLGKKRKNYSNIGSINDKEMKQKPKEIEKMNQLTRDEFNAILSNYSDEMNFLQKFNLITPNTSSSIHQNHSKKKNDFYPTSLVTDLNTLHSNLFLCTKFENSKPYKMIDYIISNDDLLLNRSSDKDKFEDMKKPIFSKGKSFSKENTNILYKSLYEYFKTDFSASDISCLIEDMNDLIQKTFNQDSNNKEQKSPTNVIEDKDKKDKFTYSNFITERIKERDNSSLISYTSDTDFVKSLIYLNNKFNKVLNKKNKIEKNLFMSLKNNLETIKELEEKNEVKNSNSNEETVFIEKILKSKGIFKKNMKKFHNFLTCIDEIQKCSLTQSEFEKIIEVISMKSKEDDFDKISKYLNFPKKIGDEKINIKNIWVCIRFLFYLFILSNNSHITSYYPDNYFWHEIFSFTCKKKVAKKSSNNCTQGANGNIESINIDNEPSMTSRTQKKGGDAQNSTKTKKGADNSSENEDNRKNQEPRNTSALVPGKAELLEEVKDIVIEKYEKGENIFTVYRDKTRKRRRKKDLLKDGQINTNNSSLATSNKINSNEYSINGTENNKDNEEKTISSKTISEVDEDDSKNFISQNQETSIKNSLSSEKPVVLQPNIFLTNQKMAPTNHKEGGIFNIFITPNDEKKKKEKSKKEKYNNETSS